MLEKLYSLFKPFSSSTMRTGTKISIVWLIFNALLVLWLIVGVVILSIYYPQISPIYPFISNIVIALLSSATIAFTTSETRKTFENINNVTRPSQDEK